MTRLLLALVLLLGPVVAGADEVPVPPPPTRWATDTAGFLSPSALQAADSALEAYERSTGNQVLVWIGPSTGDTPLEDWTVKAFERWKVGRSGLDNGLVLFVFAADRRVRIEVGYGLEDKVPDAIASRILGEDVLPRIRAGDRDGAVLAGIAAVQSAISGTPRGPEPTAPAVEDPGGAGTGRSRESSPAQDLLTMIVGGILVIGFLILLVTNPSLALYILFSILSSGGGGRGGGGGGWSGGGGRSGGGGASGSW
jgi:uncharacterized protein